MDTYKTIKLLEGPFTMLNEITKGREDGMYFIDNSKNIERRENGMNARF